MALVALLAYALLPCIGLTAEDKPGPRDAAEIVREGDVSQWLKHYQSERGADWARQQEPIEPEPAKMPGDGAEVSAPPAK